MWRRTTCRKKKSYLPPVSFFRVRFASFLITTVLSSHPALPSAHPFAAFPALNSGLYLPQSSTDHSQVNPTRSCWSGRPRSFMASLDYIRSRSRIRGQYSFTAHTHSSHLVACRFLSNLYASSLDHVWFSFRHLFAITSTMVENFHLGMLSTTM